MLTLWPTAALAQRVPSVSSRSPPATLAELRGVNPGLWVVRDEDTTIYLFGTIHALPDGFEWRTSRLDQALASATELVLETEPGADLLSSGQLMADEPASILERVPPHHRENLRHHLRAVGYPIGFFDQMSTWGVAFLIAEAGLRVRRENGVETSLIAQWRERELPIAGVETSGDRVAFFRSLGLLPEQTQRAWLTQLATRDISEIQARYDRMLAAWITGDVEALAHLDESADPPEVREILVDQRNVRWASWLLSRLQRPGIVFIAVGSAHLTGRRSVQQLLAETGLRIERVQ